MAGSSQSATVHFTFAWIQRQDGLFLIHANASHAQSGSIPAKDAAPAGKTAQARMFPDVSGTTALSAEAPENKFRFRDMEGRIHFLSAQEILYLKSGDLLCEVHTGRETFQTRATLRRLELPGFFLIHRSYLVNTTYIHAICRYQATLLDGAELPISRERYMDLKRYLQKT